MIFITDSSAEQFLPEISEILIVDQLEPIDYLSIFA